MTSLSEAALGQGSGKTLRTSRIADVADKDESLFSKGHTEDICSFSQPTSCLLIL